jgi:hypothetical protein
MDVFPTALERHHLYTNLCQVLATSIALAYSPRSSSGGLGSSSGDDHNLSSWVEEAEASRLALDAMVKEFDQLRQEVGTDFEDLKTR